MKYLKKTAAFVAAMLMSLLFVLIVSAAETGISELSLSFDAGENNISVNWWQNEGQYYVFLP